MKQKEKALVFTELEEDNRRKLLEATVTKLELWI